MRSTTLKAALAAALLFIAAPQAPAQEAQLKGAVFLSSERSLFRQVFNQFVQRVNEEGKGIVRVATVAGPEAVPPFEQPDALKTGVVDFAALPPGYYAKFIPEAEALQLASITPAEQRASGAIDFLQKLYAEKHNVHFLAQYGYGVRFHMFLNRDATSPDDLTGRRLRSAPTYRGFFRRLGISAVQTPRGEVFTALERGVVEGYVNVLSEVPAEGWDRVTKFRVDPGFWHAIVTITFNLDSWRRLTDAQRALLTRIGHEIEGAMSAAMAKDDVAIGEDLVKKGMGRIVFAGANATKFLQAADDGYWEVIAERDQANADRLKKMLVRN